MDHLTPLTLMLLLSIALLVGLGAGYLLAARFAAPDTSETTVALQSAERRASEHAVLAEGLDRLHDEMRDLAHSRLTWQGQFREQVENIRLSTESLRQETSSLSTALRKPGVRGQWGEMHLRRTVELAGMVEHCDFSEQVHLDGGTHRPDLVVHLAGRREVVVDSKVALDAFLDATHCEDAREREAHLRRHAKQLRTHATQLASKAYWRSLSNTPEFVVLFVPSEACLAAALQIDRDLLEDTAAQKVVLATPTTLIALLRTVAHGWSQSALSERAELIHGLGCELHERLTTLNKHFEKVGRSLNGSVDAFNDAMGSYDRRVMVSARKFTDLGVRSEPVDPPAQISLRTVSRRADVAEPPESPTVAS